MTTYFLINLCYECNGHVTRQIASDRQVAKFALGKPWAYQQARLPIHSRDFRHSSYLNVKLSPCCEAVVVAVTLAQISTLSACVGDLRVNI